jgi:hypothetical protein
MVGLAFWWMSKNQRGSDDAHAQKDMAKVLFHGS